MALKPASTFIPSRSPIVDPDGMATWNFLKILQDWDTKLRNGLNQIGQIIQDIPAATNIAGRVAIGIILQYVDDGGQILPNGIDFARPYLNKDTDHIADGTGGPLAGGRAAEIALVTSPPAPEAKKFVTGLTGGVFIKAQPAYSDLTGQIQFETNAVNNASQTKLNLLQGANVTITDGGSGNITIAASTTTASAYVTRFKSIDYHANANEAVFCNTGGLFGLIITLPAAASNSGLTIIVKKISTDTNNRVTISPTGGDLIDGAAAQLLSLPYASSQFVSDGVSNWWAI